MSRWVGTAVRRSEDARLLAGRGTYVADLADDATLHAAFVRSDVPHAAITVDAGAARGAAGVAAVYTGADLAGRVGPIPMLTTPDPDFVAATGFTMTDPRLPCLATDRVRYVGEPIAVVIAGSRAAAEDAAELVEVAYDPREPVVDAVGALTAPPLHPHLDGNLGAEITCAFGDVAAGHAAAAVTIEETYRMGRHGGVPLECRGVLARPVGDRLEVWTSSQIPHQVRTAVCTATGWAADAVRVAVPDVGGGFGTKANVYGEEIVTAYAARDLGRAVLWAEDRAEHLISGAQGRDQEHRAKLSVDADGRILAWEDDYLIDLGAGSLWAAGIIANTAIHLAGPYRIPAMRAHGRAAFTNKTIVAQYRGAGRPEACFALERSLDRAARELGLSPLEIRRRNVLTSADLPYALPLPYRDGVPIVYDGADFAACLDAAVALVPETEVARLRAAHPGLAVGTGVACYVEATGRGPYESGRVRLTPGGGFAVAAGSASAGQGHETTLAQVAADALGVRPEDVTVRVGDTDAVRDGIGTFASRSAVLAGSAVHEAAGRLAERARDRAADTLGVDPSKIEPTPGGFAVSGTVSHGADDPGTAFPGMASQGGAEPGGGTVSPGVASHGGAPRGSASHGTVPRGTVPHGSASNGTASRGGGAGTVSPGVASNGTALHGVASHGAASRAAAVVTWAELAEGEPLDEVVKFRPPTVTWTMGAHAAVVGVDRETGLTRVLAYGVAHEGGVEINPMIVDGQIRGGVAQGIGGALLEEYAYDATGQPESTTFAAYLLPGAPEVPDVAVTHRMAWTDRNPLNVRGVGESGTIACYPAIAAAVDDALGAAATPVTATPITPRAVVRAGAA